jgi:hypothetical protein
MLVKSYNSTKPQPQHPMNRRSLLLTILSLTAAGITGAQAQTNSSNLLFQNGNMGSFGTNGVPTGWASSTPTIVTSQSANNSPFVNAYADNGSSLSLIRAGSAAGAYQNFSSVNLTNITVNFDFMVTTLTTGDTPWGIQFDGAGAAGAPSAASAVHYRVDRDGKFAINAGPGGTSPQNIVFSFQLEAGAWYNVQANFQVTAINTGSANGAGFQSGTITKQGGSLSQSWNNVATINTTLGYSRLLVRDRASGVASGGLLIDNVSVVPEPSEYALMALGLGLTTLVILRRRKEGQAS